MRLALTFALLAAALRLHAARWPLDAVNDAALVVHGAIRAAAGVSGHSLALDGASVIELKDSASLNATADGFSFSVWFNPYVIAGSQQLLAAKNRYSLNERQWSLTIEPDGRLKAFLQQDGWNTITCPEPLQVGHWHLVSLAVGADQAALYLDGKPVGTVALKKPTPATQAPLTLGGCWDGGRSRQNFQGALDDACYEPRALSAGEIAASYHPVSATHALPKPLLSDTPLWDARVPLLKSAELPVLEGVGFHVLKKPRPDADGCNWTLGVGLAWHNGKLYASYGFNTGEENTATEEAHVRVSGDGGGTWSAPVVMDHGEGNLGVSHGVFLSYGGTLWAFQGAFYEHFQRTHTRAYLRDEATGRWQAKGVVLDDGFWPMQEPQRMADGNWIMAGANVGGSNPAAVAISHGTDFTRWDKVLIPAAAGLKMWGESTVIVSGKHITNISRYGGQALALVAASDDFGRTWNTMLPSNLPMATSKPYAGTLSTGQRYLLCTTTADTGGKRSPLTIAVGKPGEPVFSKVFVIRRSVFPEGPGVSDARADFSYPYAVEHEGKLYVGYTHKSHAANELAVIPLSKLSLTPSGAELRRETSLEVLGARATEITNSVGMRLVRMEAGAFQMGQDGPQSVYALSKHPEKFDDADWDERPAHAVTVSAAFYMAATEVTIEQYRRFRPAHGRGKEAVDSAVSAVSWFDAAAFCEWLSKKEGRPYRLPTEAEWEYACRAGTETLFNTGDALPDGFQPWNTDTGHRDRYFAAGALPKPYRSGGEASLRVARQPPNRWGLYDMHGNVAEWCLDWYGPYEPGAQTDPLGRSAGDFRVIRGGSHSVFIRLLRSANRAAWLPEAKSDKAGFRVVLGMLPAGTALPRVSPPLNAQNVRPGAVKVESGPQDAPVFSGPKPFVKIAPASFGPLFSSHNHSPSLTECPNGDLLAVWYSCVDEGGSELCDVASRLRLGSAEWEPASPFWDGADVNDHAPKVWWDGATTLYHFARGRDENIMRTSTDNGATWSAASRIDPVGEFGNQPLRLSDGTLVLGNDSRQCSLVFSRDGGRTWAFNDVQKQASAFRPGGKGFRYPGIHAPMVQLADGRIMALSRNDKPEDQETFGFKTPVSYSADLGKTWMYDASDFPAISSVQRAAMIRLREGPILLCSFTDQWRDWKARKGLPFKAADGTEFTGYGLFAALSFDEGKTWPVRRLVTPGGKPRSENMIDRGVFTLSDTMAEPCGYLAATQTRDGNVQLITSKNHYVFNLAWLKQPPPS